jgi:ATP-dependent protease ClpP protease subunit
LLQRQAKWYNANNESRFAWMNLRGLEAKVVRQKDLNVAVVEMSGEVGWPSALRASSFMDLIGSLGNYDMLYAILDSSGGSAVDSWNIYDFLKTLSSPRYGSLVLITGRCSADAILIALAFDQILMRPYANFEFRRLQRAGAAGGSKITGLVARLVAQRSGSRVEEVLRWMDKNAKLSATECLKLSLCDAIV